jgi:septal ring-binding cell division protein DamX
VSEHEPSYYEIALTNRQVLIAFVILLVCLVAAFLSGVWVGRGDARPVPPQMAEQDVPVIEVPSDEAEPLSFFGGDGSGGGARGGAVEPGAGTTLAEDLGEEVASGEVLRPVAPRTTPAAPAPRETPPAPTPAAARPEPAPARPAPSAPAATDVAGDGQVVIQVFSSRDREQAQSMVAKLVGAGRDAYLAPVEVDGQTMYRVRIGPFADRARAQQVADEVRRELKVDTWVTTR